MRRLTTIFILAAMLAAGSVQAQEGSVRTGTVTNKPKNGYEVRITFKYQFIWCYGKIYCATSLQSEEALAYHYNGKRLTAADVKEYGGFSSPGSNRSTTVDISATLMYGQNGYRACSSSGVKLTNLVSIWGGCFGDTHDIFCDSRGKDKDIIPELYLTKFSTDARYIDYALESKLKEAEKAEKEKAEKKEKYNGLIKEAGLLYSEKKYEEAKTAAVQAKNTMPEGAEHNELLQKIDKAIEKQKQDEQKAKEEDEKKGTGAGKESGKKDKEADSSKDQETGSGKDKKADRGDAEDDSGDDSGGESSSGGKGGSPAMYNEQRARMEKQRQFDDWTRKRQQELNRAATGVGASTTGALIFLGGFMYQGMGKVNPEYVYTDFDRAFKLFAGMDFGFSISTIPMFYHSVRKTMRNGVSQIEEFAMPAHPFLINVDYKLKFGVESPYIGGYGYWAPKAGFSPILESFQFSLFNGGINLYGGIKWIKGFVEVEFGQHRVWHSPWTIANESGEGDIKVGYTKVTYGLRFTTAPNRNYVRDHFLIGIIGEIAKVSDPYIAFIVEGVEDKQAGDGKSGRMTGYTFQWKRDHTFNLYLNIYPKYPYAGNNSDNLLIKNSDLDKCMKGGVFLELGFLRSIDWFFR